MTIEVWTNPGRGQGDRETKQAHATIHVRQERASCSIEFTTGGSAQLSTGFSIYIPPAEFTALAAAMVRTDQAAAIKAFGAALQSVEG